MRGLTLSSLIVLCLASAGLAAELTVGEVHFVDSKVGPKLANHTYVPGESVYMRFDVGDMRKAKLDEQGRIWLKVEVEVLGPDKAAVLKRTTLSDLHETNAFNAAQLAVCARVEMPLESKKGAHTVNIYATDVNAAAETRKQASFVVGASAFRAINIRFTADPAGKFDRPPRFERGETLRLHYGILGFKRAAAGIHVQQDLQVKDATGKVVVSMPLMLNYKGAVPAKMHVVPANLSLALNVAGKHTVILVLRDKLAGTQVVRELPIEVIDSYVLRGKAAGPAAEISMVPFIAPDKTYSLYQPKGWTVKTNAQGLAMTERPGEKNSTKLEIMPLTFQDKQYTSQELITVLATHLKKQNNTLKIISTKQLNKIPDMRAVTFSYKDAGDQIFGFAVATCRGKHALWASIYGKPKSFKNYNPAVVLCYTLSSFATGGKPMKPAIKLALLTQQPKRTAATGGEAGTGKKFNEAMFMTHYWNMAPYTLPNVFTTMPLW